MATFCLLHYMDQISFFGWKINFSPKKTKSDPYSVKGKKLPIFMCNNVGKFFLDILTPLGENRFFQKKWKWGVGRGTKNQFFQNLRSKTWFDQNGPSSKKFANFMLNNFPKFFYESPGTFWENPLLVSLPLPPLPFTKTLPRSFGGPNDKIFKKQFFCEI